MIVERKTAKVLSNSDDALKWRTTQNGIAQMIDVVADRQYKNPVLSTMIEYVQNALDSHDEGDNPDPIEITIPSEDHLYLEIRDYGIGMSASQIRKVFLAIGESTKNKNGRLRGGFGLGKLVFCAYNTKTMHLVNFQNGIKTEWLAHLSGGDGGMQQMGRAKTNEEDGVLIRIPVKKEDIPRFQEYSKKVYRFIDPRPIIKNYPEHEYLDDEILEEKAGSWAIAKLPKYEGTAVMGDLAYTIEWNNITLIPENREFRDYVDGYHNDQNLILFFDIGDVDIVSSRDSLDYGSEKTQQAINDKLLEIKQDFERKQAIFGSLSEIDKKKAIVNVLAIKNNNKYVLSYFQNNFLNLQAVKDFIEAHPSNLDWNPNDQSGNVFFGRGRSVYVRRTGSKFRLDKNEEHEFDVYKNKYYSYINKRLSTRKLCKIMNGVDDLLRLWDGGSMLPIIIAKTQEDLDKFLEENLIDPSYVQDLTDYENELSSSSAGGVNLWKVYKVTNLNVSDWAGKRNCFRSIDDFDDEQTQEKYENDGFLYTSFYMFSVGYNRHKFINLLQVAKKLGIISKNPQVLALNKIAYKKFKPEKKFESVTDYMARIQAEVDKKISEQDALSVYEFYVKKAFENHASYELRGILASVDTANIVNENLKYILGIDDECEYLLAENHPQCRSICSYARNFVEITLTQMGLDNYNTLVRELVTEHLKQA